MNSMNNNSASFEELLDNNFGIIRKVANLYGTTQDDKEDLKQEITIQLWKAFPKYDVNLKFSTWIYRIALNIAISHYRKSRTKSNLFARYDDKAYNTPAVEPETSDKRLMLLEKFISDLKELDKALILLYLDGKKHEEIADILGISVSNAGTKIGRIKQLLKQKFDSYKGE